jgi:predicted nucleic acid-binding protein
MGFLIDTCIWVDVERGRIGPADVARVTGREDVYLSPVTIAELQYGVGMASDPAIRIARQRSVDLLKRKPVLRIDEETGAIFGNVASEIRKAGSSHEYRVQDLWIAALAIQNSCILLTHNKKDFVDIPGLSLRGLSE